MTHNTREEPFLDLTDYGQYQVRINVSSRERGLELLEEMKNIHHQLQKAREEEREKWIGNDAYSFLGNELHLYCRACIDRVKITRNGEVFEFTLPKDHSELDQDNK